MKKYYVILKVFAILIMMFGIFGSTQLINWDNSVFAATTVNDSGTGVTTTPDINGLLDKLKSGTLSAEDQLSLNKLLGDNRNQLDLLNSVAKQPAPTTTTTKASSTAQAEPTTTNSAVSNSMATTIELIFIIFSALLLWLNLILLIIYLWQRIKTVDIQKNIPS